MFCRKCGCELKENATVCDQCGALVAEEVVEERATPVFEEVKPVNEVQEPKGPWKAFAVIGHIIGIVCLATIWFPFFSFVLAVDGIIFSALGKKSIVNHERAVKGLRFSIISCIVNFVLSIVFYIIWIVLLINL